MIYALCAFLFGLALCGWGWWYRECQETNRLRTENGELLDRIGELFHDLNPWTQQRAITAHAAKTPESRVVAVTKGVEENLRKKLKDKGHTDADIDHAIAQLKQEEMG